MDSVGVDEGAVQQEVLGSSVHRFVDDIGQVRGLVGEHVEGFVRVSVGAGEADTVVAG
ncbi:hypothetical protein [Kineococcus terrestris]|uniref:hypothetical protein n=1 Tax=Kineococcus terrestris TaxID=2044856 RepID=UPI0034DB71BA